MEKKHKVSLIDRIRQLTAVPRTSVTQPNIKLNKVKETVNQDACHELEPLLAQDPAAFKGNDLTQSVDDSSSSITLIDSIRHVNVTPLSLPNDRSYAHCNCVSIYVPQDPFFENSYAKSTLVNEDPEELSLYQCPDHQPPPFKPGACQRNSSLFYTMSSSIPSAGDDNLKGKTRVTNNSASRDLVTPLTTRRNGKGVSMMEELDPEALSPTNHSPMPASGPILSGPHTLDNVVSEETSTNPAASPSASRLPSSSKATSRIPAAPKSANNAKSNSLNRGARRTSTMGVNQLAAQDQQSRKEPPVTVQASTEDLLNLNQ